MAKSVSCPAEPPARLGGAAIDPGNLSLPQVLRRVVEVQDARGMGTEALIKQSPQPPGTVTESDHLKITYEALSHGFKPKSRLERLDVLQARQQPALMQPGNDFAAARAMMA